MIDARPVAECKCTAISLTTWLCQPPSHVRAKSGEVPVSQTGSTHVRPIRPAQHIPATASKYYNEPFRENAASCWIYGLVSRTNYLPGLSKGYKDHV